MRTIQLFILLGLVVGLTGCSVQSKLTREYKGKTAEELMLGMGRPTRVEPLTGGRKIEIYEKSKFLKPAPINTGQFQYDKFESPKAIKTEIYKFYFNAKGVVESVNCEVSYER
jgi:outer membrane protein assembly factor BamE (lipoprotein component of BamABCDE complex)